MARPGNALAPALLAMGLVLLSIAARAQLDPVGRRVFQAGYSLPLHEYGPLAAYGYYYYNAPDVPRTNLTLRMAIVPVYVDSELGIRHALGPQTDLGVGLSGGGFADSYSEVRRGNYFTSESFNGHAAEANTSLFHLFNPGQRMPLYAILRGGVHESFYEPSRDTAPTFQVPENETTFLVRTGLRLGGREPYLMPPLAGEVSIWYQGAFRTRPQAYGFDGDRQIESASHLFWTRGLLAYTFPASGQHFEVSLNLGTSVNADRFSAYRLGGSLELMSEFPLRLPGYHLQEISAGQYALLDASYQVPLLPSRRLSAGVFGSIAVVDYLKGLEQPGNLHGGVGGALLYRSPSDAWQFGFAYSYGVAAIREHGRGASTFSFLVQYDLDALTRAGGKPFWDPLKGANIWRGILGIFGHGL